MKPRDAAALALATARKVALIAAIFGVLGPALCLVGGNFFRPLRDSGLISDDWVLFIWPSSFGLMALQGDTPWIIDALCVAISIAINVLIFAGLAWLGGFLWSFSVNQIRTPRAST